MIDQRRVLLSAPSVSTVVFEDVESRAQTDGVELDFQLGMPRQDFESASCNSINSVITSYNGIKMHTKPLQRPNNWE